MRFYARPSPRLARQVTGDLALLVWALLWWVLSSRLEEILRSLAAPSRETTDTLLSVRSSVTSAAASLGGLPYLGDHARAPFDAIANDLTGVAGATADHVITIERTAVGVGWGTFLIPVAIVLLPWLLTKVRYARATARLAAVARTPGGLTLVAHRAFATLPLNELAAIPHVASRLQSGDPEVISLLAARHARRLGMSRLDS
ncbi:MAG: hypothetical protein Q4P36_08030 [Bowdeniella nasicola]|nr:hypothetical protein [Bowdeniella nasicola]